MNYYISDTHFSHKNVIKFDNRQFSTIEEMDEVLINNINKVCTRADHLYILGDMFWKTCNCIDYLNKIDNPNLHLIIGNHDMIKNAQFRKKFIEIVPYKELKDTANGKEYNIILSHYPILFWNKQHYGSIHLFGHVHNSLENDICENIYKQLQDKYGITGKAYNVGCMLWNYTPVTLEQIINSDKDSIKSVRN